MLQVIAVYWMVLTGIHYPLRGARFNTELEAPISAKQHHCVLSILQRAGLSSVCCPMLIRRLARAYTQEARCTYRYRYSHIFRCQGYFNVVSSNAEKLRLVPTDHEGRR